MRTTLLLSLLSALLVSAIPTRARAATIRMNLGSEFSGATAPSGPVPWATAVDDDTGDPNAGRAAALPRLFFAPEPPVDR